MGKADGLRTELHTVGVEADGYECGSSLERTGVIDRVPTFASDVSLNVIIRFLPPASTAKRSLSSCSGCSSIARARLDPFHEVPLRIHCHKQQSASGRRVGVVLVCCRRPLLHSRADNKLAGACIPTVRGAPSREPAAP
jgi:hypothetical protein